MGKLSGVEEAGSKTRQGNVTWQREKKKKDQKDVRLEDGCRRRKRVNHVMSGVEDRSADLRNVGSVFVFDLLSATITSRPK
jgi:hypothetical protein